MHGDVYITSSNACHKMVSNSIFSESSFSNFDPSADHRYCQGDEALKALEGVVVLVRTKRGMGMPSTSTSRRACCSAAELPCLPPVVVVFVLPLLLAGAAPWLLVDALP